MVEVTSSIVGLDDLAAPEFGHLLAYWQDLRGSRFAPSWTDIELIDLPAKVLPYLTVVEVRAQPMDFVYRFCGTGHMSVKARDYTGCSVTQVRPAVIAELIFDQFRRTFEARRPMAFRRTITGFGDSGPMVHTSLRLPLSADGEGVHWLISVADWDSSADMREFYLAHVRDAVAAAALPAAGAAGAVPAASAGKSR